MCDSDSNDYHKIGYLPSISKSLTCHDTVMELCSQSKLNAEKLSLLETDVVLDMATYAKAVEVMMNPRHTDLKQFIVLRLSGFHTMLIVVIGKRFADAALRKGVNLGGRGGYVPPTFWSEGDEYLFIPPLLNSFNDIF